MESLGALWPWYDAAVGVVLSAAVLTVAHRLPWKAGPLFTSISQAAYLTYIIHVPVVLAVQVGFSWTILPTPVRFLGASMVSVACSFGLACLPRKVSLVRRVVG